MAHQFQSHRKKMKNNIRHRKMLIGFPAQVNFAVPGKQQNLYHEEICNAIMNKVKFIVIFKISIRKLKI